MLVRYHHLWELKEELQTAELDEERGSCSVRLLAHCVLLFSHCASFWCVCLCVCVAWTEYARARVCVCVCGVAEYPATKTFFRCSRGAVDRHHSLPNEDSDGLIVKSGRDAFWTYLQF